ncbi:MAG TPA: magnesium/cobalt transporter CorA [Gemmatimonadota bacterium]|nr:magnesium/cobalt transporter CorA [Gemmatimonadota bacterium]
MPRRFIKRRRHKVGLPPGSLVPVEVPTGDRVTMTVMDFEGDRLEEREIQTVEECLPFRDSPTVTWLNVTGLHDMELIASLGAEFGLHPLVMEDLVNTEQRPKLEDFQDYLFMVVKMITFSEERREVEDEQVSLILGPRFVLSFQERPGDLFESVRERIRGGRGRIRTMGSDYLAYALVDAVVDHYFVVLEGLGEWIERLEEEVVTDPDPQTMGEIHRLKREMLLLRKATWPMREMVSALGREGTSIVTAPVRVYVRDVYDHTIQVLDTGETLRDIISGLLDTYLSSVSNRMNEIMKVLTIMASIFIPLTFVAGVYGMNFQHMPELALTWAYPACLGLMAVIGGGLVVYFKRKGWM